MATRLYLPSDVAADVAPVASGAWTSTAQAVNRLLAATKQNTALGLGTEIGPIANSEQHLDRNYVSAPLAAQTISGSVSGQLLSVCMGGPTALRCRTEIYVVSEDGATLRGVLLSLGASGSTNYINRNDIRNLTWFSEALDASVDAEAGDRLVVSFGYRNYNTTALTAQSKYGDPTATSDLPVDETTTSDGDGWIEFSQTLTFGPTVYDEAATLSTEPVVAPVTNLDAAPATTLDTTPAADALAGMPFDESTSLAAEPGWAAAAAVDVGVAASLQTTPEQAAGASLEFPGDAVLQAAPALLGAASNPPAPVSLALGAPVLLVAVAVGAPDAGTTAVAVGAPGLSVDVTLSSEGLT